MAKTGAPLKAFLNEAAEALVAVGDEPKQGLVIPAFALAQAWLLLAQPYPGLPAFDAATAHLYFGRGCPVRPGDPPTGRLQKFGRTAGGATPGRADGRLGQRQVLAGAWRCSAGVRTTRLGDHCISAWSAAAARLRQFNSGRYGRGPPRSTHGPTTDRSGWRDSPVIISCSIPSAK